MRLFRSRPKGPYEGPVCFVTFDHAGLEAGWHYSTKLTKAGEVPDRKLHLNDSDPKDQFYEYAEKHHISWVQKHGVGRAVELKGSE